MDLCGLIIGLFREASLQPANMNVVLVLYQKVLWLDFMLTVELEPLFYTVHRPKSLRSVSNRPARPIRSSLLTPGRHLRSPPPTQLHQYHRPPISPKYLLIPSNSVFPVLTKYLIFPASVTWRCRSNSPRAYPLSSTRCGASGGSACRPRMMLR